MKGKLIKIKSWLLHYKTLINNFGYLSALQIFNLLIPLISYPYLIRTLGKEIYGLVIYAQAIIGYLVLLVGFGFSISATKEISINRNNISKLNEIVSSVYIIKGLLFIFSLLIIIILISTIPQAANYKVLFLLTAWLCFYDFIFPQWYFQGIEKMKYITFLTLFSRLTFLILIFILINEPKDYLLVPIINGLGGILAGTLSVFIVFRLHKVKFKWQTTQQLLKYFKDSIPIFISYISIKLFLNSNKVIVGAFLGMAEVAYYDLAEKIISLSKMPQGLINQVLFPKISKDKNIIFIKKVFNYSILLNLVILTIIFFVSKYIIIFLGGYDMLPAQTVIRILAISVPVGAIGNILGIQILIPFGMQKYFTKIMIISLIFYAILIFCIYIFNLITLTNISLVILITEIFTAAYTYLIVKKYNLW